ncbi:unnamed protein product [Closterium sp. Naga37s-1]|nr:unnamed protein product [Closterium sp. Naga37s-1]
MPARFPLLVLLVSLSAAPLLRPAIASPPDVSALYIVRLRSAPPVASYRGGIPGYPATAVWESDPNGNATDATSDDTAAGYDGGGGAGTASVSSFAAAGAATTSGLGSWLGRRLRRPRVDVRAPGVRAFKQLLQRMQQAVLRDSGVAAGKMVYSYMHASNGFSATSTPLVSPLPHPRFPPSPPSFPPFPTLVSPLPHPRFPPSPPSFPLARPPSLPPFSYMHASNGFSATLTPAQVQRMRRHPSVASVTQARVVRPATTDSYKFLGLPGSLWADAGGPSSAGDGTVIGIVDTGIWPEHASFDDTPFFPIPQLSYPLPSPHLIPFLPFPSSPPHAPPHSHRIAYPRPGKQGYSSTLPSVHGGHVSQHHPTNPPLPLHPSTLPVPTRATAARSLLCMEATCPSTTPLTHRYPSTPPPSPSPPGLQQHAPNRMCMVHGVWCMGYGAWGMVHGAWGMGHGAWCMGHGAWGMVAAAGNNNVPIPNIGTASGMAPGARLAVYKIFWQTNGYMYATSPDIFSAVDQAVADGVDVLSLSLGGASPTDTYFDDVPFISVHAAGVFVAFAAGNEGRPSAFAATGYRTLCNFSPYYMTVGASTITRNGASISSTTAAATSTAASLETPSNTTTPTALAAATTVSTLNGARIPASISPAATAAPVVAYFSSTGPLAKPSAATPAAYPSNTILKPDIIAPGVQLYAAFPGRTVGSKGGFEALSGTSMATPHIAGIAALIIQQHPDWTPSQIMSAMMTTARTTNTGNGAIKNEYGAAASPWEIGAGHVVPAMVVNPGLTYDAGEQDFKNFLAGQNYKRAKGEFGTASLRALSAKNLNRPAISLPKVHNKASVTRTVTNVADTTSTYTVRIKKPAGVKVKVSPSSFTIAPGQRKTFTVTVVVKWASQSFKFGSLTWVDNKGHSVRSVLAVQPSSACWFGC